MDKGKRVKRSTISRSQDKAECRAFIVKYLKKTEGGKKLKPYPDSYHERSAKILESKNWGEISSGECDSQEKKLLAEYDTDDEEENENPKIAKGAKQDEEEENENPKIAKGAKQDEEEDEDVWADDNVVDLSAF